MSLRIISLLPSATEIICMLGLKENLVGVSHECDYPPSVARLPKVTRTLIPAAASSRDTDQLVREQLNAGFALYALDARQLAELRPDLIVTQSLCSVCAVAEGEVFSAIKSLRPAPQVITLTPRLLSDLFVSLRQVAAVASVEQLANEVIAGLQERVANVQRRTETIQHRPRVALLEWLDPPFSAGHWTPELVRIAGGSEGLGHEGEPSQTLTWREVIAWQPEVILIACCGYDIERTLQDIHLLAHVPGWQELPAVASARTYLTDGSQYFNRPGPRLIESLEILAHAIHPDHHPPPKVAPSAMTVARTWYDQSVAQAAAERSTGA